MTLTVTMATAVSPFWSACKPVLVATGDHFKMDWVHLSLHSDFILFFPLVSFISNSENDKLAIFGSY